MAELDPCWSMTTMHDKQLKFWGMLGVEVIRSNDPVPSTLAVVLAD